MARGRRQMARDPDDLGATHAQLLFMSVGRRLGLNAAYHAFGYAAELEDRSEILRAAAWQVVGRTIVVALSSPSNALDTNNLSLGLVDPSMCHTFGCADLFAAAPDVRLRTRRIADNLDILIDAGRKGGSISAASVSGIAQILRNEIGGLLNTLDSVFAPGVARSAEGEGPWLNAPRK